MDDQQLGEPRPAQDESAPSDGQLLELLAAGDEAAAGVVFQRYAQRLTALARSRLSRKLAARLDPDDVMMSAMRSFFVRANRGAFMVASGGDLWQLLVEITLHKLYRQATRHGAARRSFAREEPTAVDAPSNAASREPSPDTAAILAEELEAVMRPLPPQQRSALELRLQGEELHEIARRLDCSDRTVRRWLEECKARLRERFPAAVSADRARPPAVRGLTSGMPPNSAPQASERARPPGPERAFHDLVLQRQIGAGATGKVYQALDRTTGRSVAVKFLRKSLLRNRRAVARFEREIELLSSIRHEGVVSIHATGRTPTGGRYLVMDLCPGGDVGQVRPGTIELALDWTRQAARALAAIHRAGIVHGDVKPQNLLIAEDGRIVVADLSLAGRLDGDAAQRAQLGGTPAFLAPEQIEPAWGPISPRTDLYGLGAVLLYLVTGRPPRSGGLVELLADVSCGRPVLIPETVPANVAELCRRCLAGAPAERFADMDEFLAGL